MRDAPPLHDPDFHSGDPFPAFRRLRAESPVHWHPTPGFWAVTRHEDVVAVSRDPATFCSSRGVLLSDIERPVVPRQSIIYIDPPEHAKYRKLVQPAFTPGRLRALEERIIGLVRELLAAIDRGATVDFVEAFAAPLPMLVIADMLGVPGSDHDRFKRWSDAIIDAGTQPTPDNMAQSAELLAYFSEVLAERRQRPGDDLLSVLAHSEIDGERLEEFDLLMFCLTLLVAGNETTRNLISAGLVALAAHPEQWAALRADPALVPTAVEELLRWTTPVISFMRTATADCSVRGQAVSAGDPVLLVYASANRDEEVFGADAGSLRVDRHPNPHVSFGFGPHFCLGAALARLEGRVVLTELVRRFATVNLAGPVERTASPVIAGVRHAPLVFA